MWANPLYRKKEGRAYDSCCGAGSFRLYSTKESPGKKLELWRNLRLYDGFALSKPWQWQAFQTFWRFQAGELIFLDISSHLDNETSPWQATRNEPEKLNLNLIERFWKFVKNKAIANNQRGLWTDTKKGVKYFESVTGGCDQLLS